MSYILKKIKNGKEEIKMAQEQEYKRAKDVIDDINKLEANPERKKEYSDETQKIEKRIADDKKLLDDINKKINEADSEKDFLKFSDNNVDDELLLKRQDEIFKKRKEFDDERAKKQNLKEISNIKEKMEDYDIYGAEADKIHNQRKEIYQKQLDILKKHPNKDLEEQLKKKFPEFAAENQKSDAQIPKTENPNIVNSEKNAEKTSEKNSDAANAVNKVLKSKDGKEKEAEKLLSSDKKKSWTGKHQKELIGVGIAAVVMMALGLIIKAVSNKNKNEAAAKKDGAINAENREKRASELVSEIDREKGKEKEKDNEKDNEKNLDKDKDKDTDRNTLKENSSTESIKKLAESSSDSLKTADENTNKESADKNKSKKSSAKEDDGKKAIGKTKGRTDEKNHKKPENLDGLKANKSTLKTAKSSSKTVAKKPVSTALKKKPQSKKGR